MAAFISRKQSLLFLIIGLCMSAGIVLLLCNFGMETRLTYLYDFLLKLRSPPPVSNEIVLIETGEIVEGGDVFDALTILSEFGSSALVIGVPIIGISSDRTLTDEEIRQRINDEYVLLGRNIHSLFDAIKMGSINPAESQWYVNNLVELADRGRDRLAAFLLRNAAPDSIFAVRTAGIFVTVLEATDLGSDPSDSSPWYSRPTLDADGTLRRIAPIMAFDPERRFFQIQDNWTYIDHIVYRAMRQRWDYTGIEDVGARQVLVAGDYLFPLDYNGNILIEKLHEGDSFRTISIKKFRSYSEADLGFRRLLKDAESLGAYTHLRPERIPLYQYDYTIDLLDDLLKDPSPEKHSDWLHARREYFECLADFLEGDSETKLLNAFATITTTERFRPDSLARMLKMRDDLVVLFEEMREKHGELIELRSELETALNSAFCIMGPPIAESAVVEASALLANTLLTGRSINVGEKIFTIICSLAVVFFLLLALHRLSPFWILTAGFIASFMCVAGFGWSFVITGYWLDPQISAIACLAGILVMSSAGFIVKRRRVQQFRSAYSGAVNKKCLKQLVRAGKPSQYATHTARAAIVAVKYSGLLTREDRGSPMNSAKMAACFRTTVKDAIMKAGGTLVSCEADIVLVCFGSTLERTYLNKIKSKTKYDDNDDAVAKYHPAVKAVEFVRDFIKEAPHFWRFGIDYGECAFSWSKETGFTAHGRPVVRSRILSSLALRYKSRIIISNTVREKINQEAQKLHVLGAANGSPGEAFYSLPVK